ncbi:MAG: virulence protein RhuM/Fic/DOC family protein [Coriobacteriia bacterium]|nr:virulence protein RhuM/Fic/DOC family protein [Coriobacteriia bacterium]
MSKSTQVAIFQSGNQDVVLTVDPSGSTIWATQAQIVDLFGVDQSGVSRHIRNIFSDGEVNEKCNMQIMHNSSSDRPVSLYSLDVILSVGYRASSARAIEFRKWANAVLGNYIIDGAAVNARRLEEIGKVVSILNRSNEELISGVASVLEQYSDGLKLLESYDAKSLVAPKGTTDLRELNYEEARELIDSMPYMRESDLFGREKDDSFKSALATVYQTFGGHDLYPSVQEKAANLLYLIIKNHPFNDGNKRIAATMFVYFLSLNGALIDESQRPLIANNTLAAITLMIALSKPDEKEMMCLLVMNMLKGELAA